jgi:hypothetical protein
MQQQNPQNPVAKLAETAQQKTERIRNDEKKRHASRTMEQLRERFGVPPDEE